MIQRYQFAVDENVGDDHSKEDEVWNISLHSCHVFLQLLSKFNNFEIGTSQNDTVNINILYLPQELDLDGRSIS